MGDHTRPLTGYDWTTHVPLIFRHPGIAAGKTSNLLVSNYDFLPTVLDYLGIRSMRLQSYPAAVSAFRAAADLAPNPRFLIQWGLAATEAEDYRSALEAYERLIARTPNDPLAWRGYTAMTSRLGDLSAARHGATELLKRVPGDPDAVKLLHEIDRLEAAKPAGTGR